MPHDSLQWSSFAPTTSSACQEDLRKTKGGNLRRFGKSILCPHRATASTSLEVAIPPPSICLPPRQQPRAMWLQFSRGDSILVPVLTLKSLHENHCVLSQLSVAVHTLLSPAPVVVVSAVDDAFYSILEPVSFRLSTLHWHGVLLRL